MSEQITVIKREKQHALCISEIVGTMKLGKVMGPAYENILEHFKNNEVELGEKDIPFTVYKNIEWDRLKKKGFIVTIQMMFFQKWDLDIGIPCPESVKGNDKAREMYLEPGQYIRLIHNGPYMKVGDTYKKIQSYAGEQNLSLKNYSIEFYLNDPREVSADQLETEVLVPIL